MIIQTSGRDSPCNRALTILIVNSGESMADETYHRNDISDESQDEYNSDLDSDGELSISPSPASRQLQIQPYQFEPLPRNIVQSSANGMSVNTNNIERRAGNVNWCECEHCRVMETEIESICCKDEVPPDYFDEECVTLSSNFESVCLHPEVLKATLGGLNNLRGDQINIQNRSLRYAAYRIFTWWVHNRLGQGVRNTYPEPNQVYIPFQEAMDEVAALFS